MLAAQSPHQPPNRLAQRLRASQKYHVSTVINLRSDQRAAEGNGAPVATARITDASPTSLTNRPLLANTFRAMKDIRVDPPFPDTAIIPFDTTRLAADAALVREALLIRERSAYTLDDVRRYTSARQAAARLGITGPFSSPELRGAAAVARTASTSRMRAIAHLIRLLSQIEQFLSSVHGRCIKIGVVFASFGRACVGSRIHPR